MSSRKQDMPTRDKCETKCDKNMTYQSQRALGGGRMRGEVVGEQEINCQGHN
jgi:hypothetical protein